MKVLNIYKYYYKFTFEKLRSYVDNPILMLFTLQYIKDTQMGRIHTRDTLMKNTDAYYKAIATMVNLSSYKVNCHNLMSLVLEDEGLYEFE